MRHGLAFHVYIVANLRTKAIYIGHTDDLVRRANEHRGGFKSTWAARNFCRTLVWFEAYETRDEAKTRERQMKRWKRAWKIREIESLNPDWKDLLDEHPI